MEKYKILEKLSSPDELKNFDDDTLARLCRELRGKIIETTLNNGGHLASNLGTVELAVALHRVFSAPDDHIIWDVGHQCYAHKLLTGRYAEFDTLRQPGGISGFPKITESPYDCFGTGHSSTSLSAALGFAEAERLKGSGSWTVAVLGDGAFTGGMIHEALNNCRRDLRLIIVLNENEMSISKNIGAFARYMAKIRSSKSYYRTKRRTARFILHIPFVGRRLFRGLRSIKQALKNRLYGSNYFENLGLYYLGPVDGNDRVKVERLLHEAVNAGQSAVVHLKTVKGKGYAPAEADPASYHSYSPAPAPADTFSSKFGGFLTEMAHEHEDICAVTAAMSAGTGLEAFRASLPKRFFDVGIAEEHAATFCAGLAADGMRPFFAVYSSFLQRAYDNVLHDIALQHLPVVLCVDRAGLNMKDGATHHGIFDVAFLSHTPGMTIFVPATFDALRLSLEAAYRLNAPAAVRYPSGGESERIRRAFYPNEPKELRGAVADYTEPDKKSKIIITYGKEALSALDEEAGYGEKCGVILLETLKPYDKTAYAVLPLLPRGEAEIVFLEEGIENGGAAMLLEAELRRMGVLENKTVGIKAIKDTVYGYPPNDAV